MNRIVSIADSIGSIKSKTYDPTGNILTETNGLGETMSYSYDEVNRRMSQTDAMGHTTAYSYDASGNVLTITDPKGSVKQFSYNNLNQTISETDPLGHSITYSYNTAGQLLSITDAKGSQTGFFYNEINKVSKKTYADGSFYTYTYDPVGNHLASRTDAMGELTTYTYDNLNRLIRVDYPGSEYKVFSYDSVGNMQSANTVDTSISFLWDSANRMTQTTQNGHGVNYAYNLFENSRTITYPNGKVVKEIYNQRNLLNRIEDSSSASIITYTLDGASRLQKKTYANGIEGIYTRNANGQETILEYKRADVQLVGLSYNYNADNTINSKEKMHGPGSSESYIYDSRNQLTGYKVGQLTAGYIPNPSSETNYAFDPMGNWDSIATNGITQTRSHNQLNQATSIDAVNFLYDYNGNLIDDGNKTYNYNTENRLVKVTRKSDNQLLAQYMYDALGRRVSKLTASKMTTFIYEGKNFLTLAELSSTGSTEKNFVWGMDLSGGKAVGGIGGLIEVENINMGSKYVCLNDMNGNVVLLADADTGQITGEYTYSPFGRLVSAIGPDATANPFRFSSKYHDAETGNYYYGFRYYSPELGRWTAMDPIGENGGLHLYAFLSNNPLNGVDWLGLKWKKINCWTIGKSGSFSAYALIGGEIGLGAKGTACDCCSTETGEFRKKGYLDITGKIEGSLGIGLGGKVDLPVAGTYELLLKGPQFSINNALSLTKKCGESCPEISITILDIHADLGGSFGIGALAGIEIEYFMKYGVKAGTALSCNYLKFFATAYASGGGEAKLKTPWVDISKPFLLNDKENSWEPSITW